MSIESVGHSSELKVPFNGSDSFASIKDDKDDDEDDEDEEEEDELEKLLLQALFDFSSLCEFKCFKSDGFDVLE